MTLLPHIAGRVFDTPLLISRAKLDTILGVLSPRLSGGPLPEKQDPVATGGYDRTPDGIAILSVLGTMVRRTVGLEAQSGLCSYAMLGHQLGAAVADSQVKAILLDIDSPGGEAGGAFDFADQIYAARKSKPIWAVADDEAFSAAYAIAASASKIYVSRTGGVGSIGVIAVHLDQSQAEADAGLKYTAIYAGARKNDLSPHEPLSDPARNVIQAEVNRVYGLFVSTVARGRKLSPDDVKATEAGMFFGPDAVAAGLADKLGTFDDALSDLTAHIAPSRLSLSPLRNPKPKDMRMTQENELTIEAQGAGTAPMQPSVDVDAIKVEAKKEALAYVAEVNDLCLLAGALNKAPDFIAKGTPVAEVRKALLTAKAVADEATAIASQIPTTTAASTEPKIDTAAIYASRNNQKG
ncbi:MAG: S49 family peptidase [Alphaproteobacteria bacterium]|nr:S49 family peptidase [Alphaproteobacteria bacterium]